MAKHCKNQISKNGTVKSFVLKEQCPESPQLQIEVNLLVENGKLWIRPEGFGDRCSEDGEGWPIGIEIWQGRLRLIVFDDINREDPQIIDLEKSKESCRLDHC